MTQTQKAAAAVAVIINTVLGVLLAVEAVDWTTAQAELVFVAVNVTAYLALALWAHLRPGTKREPVQVAASLTGTVSAWLGVLVAFQVVHLTDAQIGVLVGAVPVIVGAISGLLARERVEAPTTPS